MKNMKNKKVALFGDSIMFGSGNCGLGVGEYLEKDLGVKILKYCVGGARTGYYEGKNWLIMQARQAIADNIKPDYIVFNCFTNDCYRTDGVNFDVPLGEISEGFENFNIMNLSTENTDFSNCFETLLSAFKIYFPSAKVLFVRPHKMGRREEEAQKIYGDRAAALCKKWGVSLADIYTDSGLDTFKPEHRDLYTNDSYGWGKGDSTHPNATGYEKFYMPIIERKLEEL